MLGTNEAIAARTAVGEALLRVVVMRMMKRQYIINLIYISHTEFSWLGCNIVPYMWYSPEYV